MEVVQRAYAALTRGDGDTVHDLVAPGMVVDFSRRLVDPFVLRGRDEAPGYFLSQAPHEPWDDWPVWEPQEVIDAGDKIAALIRFSARGEASGVEVEAHVWGLWTFRDGKAVEFKYFGDDQAGASKPPGSRSSRFGRKAVVSAPFQ